MCQRCLCTSELFSVFMVLISALSYFNSRFWKLSPTITMLISGLVVAGGVALADALGWPAGTRIRELMQAPFPSARWCSTGC